MRILLVEDEPSAARFIAKGLREASHAVDVASDGTAAAERCQQNDYDAVILDVMLPGKDGLTLCRELRSDGSMSTLITTARRGRGPWRCDAGERLPDKPFVSASSSPACERSRARRRPLSPERIGSGTSHRRGGQRVWARPWGH
jgi:CheY-like chemotaxis protein